MADLAAGNSKKIVRRENERTKRRIDVDLKYFLVKKERALNGKASIEQMNADGIDNYFWGPMYLNLNTNYIY